MDSDDKLVIQKDNQIVQNTINKFTHKQNQLMCVLLGKFVHMNDGVCIDTSVSIEDLRTVLGIKSDGGNVYIRIKNAIKAFGENSSVGILEKDKKGKIEYVWWPYFKQIRLSENECVFSWNDLMKPYLTKLQGAYTQYLANDYLKLGSIYSQNLYELMKSYENWEKVYKQKKVITVDELRRVMRVDGKKTYETYRRFNDKVLKPAINDINENTDIFVVMNAIKKGRNVVGCEFTIKKKDEKFDYNGCWLSGDEINDIFKRLAKNKILDLGKIKQENKQYYTLLRQGNKSDYEIILNFIEQDKIKAKQEQSTEPRRTEIVPEWLNKY